jgi:hypothetical protein
MNYEEIKSALDERGYNVSAAAEVLGKSRTMLTLVAQRKETSRKVAVALAVLIDRPIEEVFPDVPAYHEDPKAERKRKVAEGRKKLLAAGIHCAA